MKKQNKGGYHYYSNNPLYIGQVFKRPVIKRLKEHLKDDIGKCLKDKCKNELLIKVAEIEVPGLQLSAIFATDQEMIDAIEYCLIYKYKPECNTLGKDAYLKALDIKIQNKGKIKPLSRVSRCDPESDS